MTGKFRGSNQTRVDEKGRLKIPAEFRPLLGEKPKFYITSGDGRRAQVYPMAEWEKKEAALSLMPEAHPVRRRIEDVTGYYGQEAEMDLQGRVLLPQVLREDARLLAEVVVIGKMGTTATGYLEVVNHDEMRGGIKAAPLTDEDYLVFAEFEKQVGKPN